MVKENRLVQTFIDMASISSPSLKEREVGDYLLKALKELGMEAYEDNAGEVHSGNCGNIIGVLKAPGKKKVLFSAHMDTVLPCDKVTPIIKDGVITSDGTSVLGGDDKGGIAAILEMINVIKENNLDHPEIIVVFSIAEEIGLRGARVFDIEKYSPDYSFILDSSGKPGVAIIQAPYSAKGEMKIIGKPAHAGISPENGINALTVASHAITKIRLGRIDSETTSNIGIVRGGEAVNIVMPELSIMYEARSFQGEKLDNLLKETNDIFEATAKEFGAEFINDVKKGYDGFTLDSESEILKCFTKACANVGLECTQKSSGGGSDANVYNTKGFTAVNLAVGMSKVHTKEEFIEIKDMVDTAKLILEVSKELSK